MASLSRFAARLGLSFHTVGTRRWAAAQRPVGHRSAGVSYEVHRTLASYPDRFELARAPPLNERMGLHQWTGEAAERAMDWKSEGAPVTAAEKVEAIRELAEGNEAVAAVATTEAYTASCPYNHSPAPQVERATQWQHPMGEL